MNIQRIVVGELEENCYILEKNGKVLIIDPGDEAEKIISHIKGEVVGILVTHYHFDHVGALKELVDKYHVLVNDYKGIDFIFEIIDTLGHTSDSKTFYFKQEKAMFVGDFLFKNGIGRVDLPTGSALEMRKSLTLIFQYPDDIIIYPGHGDKSSLGQEKRHYF